MSIVIATCGPPPLICFTIFFRRFFKLKLPQFRTWLLIHYPHLRPSGASPPAFQIKISGEEPLSETGLWICSQPLQLGRDVPPRISGSARDWKRAAPQFHLDSRPPAGRQIAVGTDLRDRNSRSPAWSVEVPQLTAGEEATMADWTPPGRTSDLRRLAAWPSSLHQINHHPQPKLQTVSAKKKKRGSSQNVFPSASISCPSSPTSKSFKEICLRVQTGPQNSVTIKNGSWRGQIFDQLIFRYF